MPFGGYVQELMGRDIVGYGLGTGFLRRHHLNEEFPAFQGVLKILGFPDLGGRPSEAKKNRREVIASARNQLLLLLR